jgi:sugar lactone lactonase YvrE
MRKAFIGLLSFISISFWIVSVSAGGPAFWRVNTRAEIEKGDARGVSIADNGALTLSPALIEVFDTKQAYIWSAAADKSGNIYLGTGHEGRVFKVDPSGKGTLLYKTSELDVMALAVDSQGNVYAGTAPDGKIYRISPGGEAKVFFEPKTKYIWSLAFDGQGRLLVGTGDKGAIFRVNPDGTGAPFVTTSQTNITALRIASSGAIIAGTDPGGLVLRISPEGRVFTLFDSSQREIRDLALGRNDEIYALALSESAWSGATNTSSAASSITPPATSQNSGEDGNVTITISDLQVVDTPSATSSVSSSAGGQSKSSVYRLDADGASDVIWDSKEAVAFALATGGASDGSGRVLVGTGQKGRIYQASSGEKPTLIAQTSEAQTSRLIRAGAGGDQLFAASSNLGKLFRVSNETAASGTYTSSVRDAQASATWGRVSWVGEGAIELQTRSGNTGNPDSTWSDWSAPIASPDGDAIKSPSARFIQWRATLKRAPNSASPRLREVTVSYLPRNLAPKIASVTVLPAGVSLQALPQQQPDVGADQAGLDPSILGAVSQIPPRRVFQRGAISLQWQAEDKNGDTIEYSVYYRDVSNSAGAGGDFYPLKTGLRDNYYTIDPNALPDGRYIFKVVASDDVSNPGGQSLKDEQETEPIELDNTPPAVSADAPQVAGSNVEVVFRAADATSIIRRAEYQIDGGLWKTVFPVDGIADSKREEFRVAVVLSDKKPHVIALRAFDANANVGSAQASIK